MPQISSDLKLSVKRASRAGRGVARRAGCANQRPMTRADLLAGDFATLSDLVRAHAGERPDAVAAADPVRRLTWAELDAMVDRIAARLQAEGLAKGDRTAIAGLNSVEQMAAILGTLRAGGVAGLITNSATGEQMAAMIADTGARHLFLDSAAAASLERSEEHTSELQSLMRISYAVFCLKKKT